MDFTLSTLALTPYPRAANLLPATYSSVAAAVTLFGLARSVAELNRRRLANLQPALNTVLNAKR